MRRLLNVCGVSLAVLAVAGCESDGLSTREGQGRNVASYTYSLYDAPGMEDGPPPVVRFPAAVAVAQVGEVAPPERLLAALRADPSVFRRVEGIPGVSDFPGVSASGGNGSGGTGSALSSATTTGDLLRMERLARDERMDGLIIVGGAVDSGSNATALSVFDLTFVGAFVVPSRDVQAHARASAVLIDLRTRRVAQTFTAEARRGTLAPAVGVEEGRVRLLEDLRDDVVRQLGSRIVADCEQRAGGAGEASAP